MPLHLFQCCTNFNNPDAICWSFFNFSWYCMIPFIFFIHQFFHVLPWIFNSFLIYNHFTWYSFHTVWPCYILSFFHHLLCHLKNFILALRIIQITCTFLLFLFLCRGNNPLCTVFTTILQIPPLISTLAFLACLGCLALWSRVIYIR